MPSIAGISAEPSETFRVRESLAKQRGRRILRPVTRRSSHRSRTLFLGIEGGATHTVALLADAQGRLVKRVEAGPANVRLLTNPQLAALLRSLARQLPRPSALALGLAGARTTSDRERIRRAASAVWPGVPTCATNDLETALMAGEDARRGSLKNSVRVLVLSGTGSCCYGRATDGTEARTGGWGQALGDRGSGYEIGLQAVRTVVRELDHKGKWPHLGERVLQRLMLNTPEDLIGWIQQAGKTEVGALAREVFAAAAAGDRIARAVLASAAANLTIDALACARRLASSRSSTTFVFAGSVLLKQPAFARRVARGIRASWPKAVVAPLKRESAWGAVELARALGDQTKMGGARWGGGSANHRNVAEPAADVPSLPSLARSPTEQRNPRSLNLDRLSPAAAIDLMLSEVARIPPALRAERAKLETALRWIVRAFRAGGRLFYVGAGTSGRLGVLDASECPPTFRTPPEQVQGLIAGGQTALGQSVEGAEDDAAAGAEGIAFRGVGPRDVVVGIAASGRTPFVWGALHAARERGARTILLCFNPHLEVPPRTPPHLILAPDLGPEVLTGSTRLNAGTATKVVLNLFTTLAMVRLGKVVSNLMVDLNPSNLKLRDRAVRIVRELTGVDETRARTALERSGWEVKRALRRLGRS
jgi:N-acetylmuramic acid 6-phosphate etherase